MQTAVYLPDVRLVRRIRDGDRDALARLLGEQAPALLQLFRHLLINPDEAEDRLHDALAELGREALHFDERSSVAVQSLRVAMRFLDPPQRESKRRGGDGRGRLSLRLPFFSRRKKAQPQDDGDTPVLTALDSLPTRLRLPCVLQAVGRLSAAEIGEVLCLDERKVTELLHRGHLAIAARMG